MQASDAFNRTRNAMLASRVRVADRWWTRLRGLLGRPALEPGEGLLISPCRSVHTFGMRYPIDVLFLAADGRVVARYPDLPPGSATRHHRDAATALELPAGAIRRSGTGEGDLVVLGLSGVPGETRHSARRGGVP